MKSLQQEINDAMGRGDYGTANTLQEYMTVGNQMYGQDFNSMVGSNLAAPSAPAAPAVPAAQSGFGILKDTFDILPNFIFGKRTDKAPGFLGEGGVIPTIGGAVSGVKGAFDFITDVPRVATTVIGGIMIAVGLIALTRVGTTVVLEKIK